MYFEYSTCILFDFTVSRKTKPYYIFNSLIRNTLRDILKLKFTDSSFYV